MILGVSHIVLGSTDLTRDKLTLESIGWKTQFEQHGIPTHPGKRPFMSTSSDEQGLVFMHPPQGTPVELICYADQVPDHSPSPMQILLPQSATHPGMDLLTCTLQFDSAAPVPSLITHFVTDMKAAQHFWQQGLGFKPSSIQDGPKGSIRLEFCSIMPQWRSTLLLVPRRESAIPNLLDGSGYRCLSFMCKDLLLESSRLGHLGINKSTGLMNLEINGKSLELEIFSGPDGVMIEFFHILGNTSNPA